MEERGYFPFVEFLIRKLTHFMGFGCIALGLYFAWGKGVLRQSIAIGGTAIIAVLDEFRQGFTPGRTMSAQDVLVDTAGAIVLLVSLLQ